MKRDKVPNGDRIAVQNLEFKPGDVIIVNGIRRYRVVEVNRNGFAYAIDDTPASVPENRAGHCWHQQPDQNYPGLLSRWTCCHCGGEGWYEDTIPEGHGSHFVGNRVAAGGRHIYTGNLLSCPARKPEEVGNDGES